MKRPLILTLMLVVLISTVCSTAAVSAAPTNKPVIMVYNQNPWVDDMVVSDTPAHPSPTGNLRPFTSHGADFYAWGSSSSAGSQLTVLLSDEDLGYNHGGC